MERYDANRGAASTFFYSYIVHEMQMYIDSFINKTTPHYSTNIRKIKKAIATLSEKKVNYTTVNIAQATNLTMEAVEQAMNILSYSDEVHYDNCTDAFMRENLQDSGTIMGPEESVMESEQKSAIEKALSSLTKDERNVVMMAVGYENGKAASHKEISNALGIPLDKVKKMYAEAIRKLRDSDLKKSYHDFIAGDELNLKQSTPIPILDIDLVVDEADELVKSVDINF
jgi:RNA polymerase sigma factor (sigma-70 family)